MTWITSVGQPPRTSESAKNAHVIAEEHVIQSIQMSWFCGIPTIVRHSHDGHAIVERFTLKVEVSEIDFTPIDDILSKNLVSALNIERGQIGKNRITGAALNHDLERCRLFFNPPPNF